MRNAGLKVLLVGSSITSADCLIGSPVTASHWFCVSKGCVEHMCCGHCPSRRPLIGSPPKFAGWPISSLAIASNSAVRRAQLFNDLVPYMTNRGDGADGQHNAIGSWFWWCYPSNGGDTGGIVQSDWFTVSWNKVRTTLSPAPPAMAAALTGLLGYSRVLLASSRYLGA